MFMSGSETRVNDECMGDCVTGDFVGPKERIRVNDTGQNHIIRALKTDTANAMGNRNYSLRNLAFLYSPRG